MGVVLRASRIGTHQRQSMSKCKATNLGVPSYRFGHALLPGDIILSTVRNSFESKLIRLATGSPFSHAALYRGEMNVLEAIDFGVTNYSIMRRGVRDHEQVCIRRVIPSVDRKIVNAALQAAEGYRARGYWTAGAVKSLIGNPTSDPAGRFFCSYFVAQVFADAGLAICPGVLPYDVTPELIRTSLLLEDKTREVLVPIRPGYESTFEAIDCSQVSTPAHALLDAERAILAQAAEVLRRANLRPPATLDDLIKILVLEAPPASQADLDAQVCQILDGADYENIDSRILDRIAVTAKFPVAPKNMAPEILAATIGVHRQTLRKWLAKLQDLDDELAAGNQLTKMASLGILQRLQKRTTDRRRLLVDAIKDISATIEDLERVRDSRSRGQNS